MTHLKSINDLVTRLDINEYYSIKRNEEKAKENMIARMAIGTNNATVTTTSSLYQSPAQF